MHELGEHEQIRALLRDYLWRDGMPEADRRERLLRLLAPTERMAQWTRGRPEAAPWRRLLAALRAELGAP